MNKDFIEIVKAAKNGDNLAYEALYNMTGEQAYFVALSITHNEQDALDILQDSYLAAFQSLDGIINPEMFDNWLYATVANKGKDYLKKKKPMLFDDIPNEAEYKWNENETNDDYIPQQSLDNRETSRLVMDINKPTARRPATLYTYVLLSGFFGQRNCKCFGTF